MVQKWQKLHVGQSRVAASFLQTTQSCSHLLLPTLARWSSSQMLDRVLEANQEILQRLPIEAPPPTEYPVPPNRKTPCPPTPLFFPSHFHKGYGEGSLLSYSCISLQLEDSPNLNQLQRHFSQVTNWTKSFPFWDSTAGWSIIPDPFASVSQVLLLKVLPQHAQVQVPTAKWHSLFIHGSGLVNACT